MYQWKKKKEGQLGYNAVGTRPSPSYVHGMGALNKRFALLALVGKKRGSSQQATDTKKRMRERKKGSESGPHTLSQFVSLLWPEVAKCDFVCFRYSAIVDIVHTYG